MAWSALAAGGNCKVHGHVTADNSSKKGFGEWEKEQI